MLIPLLRRTRTNPVFYEDRLRSLLSDDPERFERMRTRAGNPDLLTWNIFASLDSHRDQEWLAYLMQRLGGPNVRPPVRISLFSGGSRAPHLLPSVAYLTDLRRRTGVEDGARDSIAVFEQPIEVPVRIESPDVLLLVDTGGNRLRTGAGGRDRLAEIVDAGLEHARRLSSSLAVAVVANPGSRVLTEVVPRLSDQEQVRRLVPWRREVPPVLIRGMSWPELVQLWKQEREYLDVDGEPVRDFITYAERATG